MHFIFDGDEASSFETLRAIAYTPYCGADIGEVERIETPRSQSVSMIRR